MQKKELFQGLEKAAPSGYPGLRIVSVPFTQTGKLLYSWGIGESTQNHCASVVWNGAALIPSNKF